MRIGLVAPVYERVPPLLHGGTERTVALLGEELQARGHAVTVFASEDSEVQAPLIAPIKRALRYSDAWMDPSTATLLQVAQAYEHASEFDLMHNHARPYRVPVRSVGPGPNTSRPCTTASTFQAWSASSTSLPSSRSSPRAGPSRPRCRTVTGGQPSMALWISSSSGSVPIQVTTSSTSAGLVLKSASNGQSTWRAKSGAAW